MPMTEKALKTRDAKRNIGAELLQSVRDLKAGRWARKTTFETPAGWQGEVSGRTTQRQN